MSSDDRARTPEDVPVAEMERLLSLALDRGGQFADLYFEHHRSSSLLLEEGIIRTASMGITCGLGVRVVSGERTSVQLSSQDAHIRKMQHQMAKEANLYSRSSGSEPRRRVTIYANR